MCNFMFLFVFNRINRLIVHVFGGVITFCNKAKATIGYNLEQKGSSFQNQEGPVFRILIASKFLLLRHFYRISVLKGQ